MKILFYDTKSYDKESFEATLAKYPGIQIEYIRPDLDPRTGASQRRSGRPHAA